MVSKIFPADELGDRTIEFARRIAALPTMASLLIKEAVNQTVDNMGFYNSLNACFTLHELNHLRTGPRSTTTVGRSPRKTREYPTGAPLRRSCLAVKDQVHADQ